MGNIQPESERRIIRTAWMDEIEIKLDEADDEARKSDERYMADEVFARVRERLHEIKR